jgi:fatty-acid desaturase
VRFFHNNWKWLWIGSTLVAALISPAVFVAFILMPAILAPIGFGMVNAITHRDNKVSNVPWINILVAGEGYHKGHHNGKTVRYHKYDHTGWALEHLITLGIFESNGKQ